jgi:hypothetical protein
MVLRSGPDRPARRQRASAETLSIMRNLALGREVRRCEAAERGGRMPLFDAAE